MPARGPSARHLVLLSDLQAPPAPEALEGPTPVQQVPDAPEPSTQFLDPEDLKCGDKCGQCSLVIQDNWNCSNGCPGKKIREAFSKSAPHCLAAHNAEPLVCVSGMIAAAYKKIDSKADSTAKAVENSNSSSPPPRAQGEGG
jgi:hypothetical protein